MMFGVGETLAQRVEHLAGRARSAGPHAAASRRGSRGRSRKENTALDGKVEEAGGLEYLKTLAVSRLFFDNIHHVQGSWVTQGPKIGQTSPCPSARTISARS